MCPWASTMRKPANSLPGAMLLWLAIMTRYACQAECPKMNAHGTVEVRTKRMPYLRHLLSAQMLEILGNEISKPENKKKHLPWDSKHLLRRKHDEWKRMDSCDCKCLSAKHDHYVGIVWGARVKNFSEFVRMTFDILGSPPMTLKSGIWALDNAPTNHSLPKKSL